MSEQVSEVSGEKYHKHIDLYADYGDVIGAVDYVDHMGSKNTWAMNPLNQRCISY